MLCAEPTHAEQLCSLLSSHLRGSPVSPFSRLSSVGLVRRPLHNVFDLHKCAILLLASFCAFSSSHNFFGLSRASPAAGAWRSVARSFFLKLSLDPFS